MKNILTISLIFILGLSFSQTNDDLRTGANKKKTSKTSSGSTTSSSSNTGTSIQHIQLLLNAVELLYNVGLLTSGVAGRGIKKNSEMIRARIDSFPRIMNMELNLGYGFFPDNYASFTPKLRLQGGIFGTSVRGFIRQDRNNAFVKDFFTTASWQILELNYLNRKHVTLRTGMGFVYNKTSEGGVASSEIATSADFFIADELLRFNIEGRITPFGEVNFRKEVNARIYLRPTEHKKIKLEVFGGGYYTNLFDEFDIYSIEAGVGIMIY